MLDIDKRIYASDRDLENAHSSRAYVQRDIQVLQNQIREISKSKTSWAEKFGNGMSSVLKEIEKRNWRMSPPIGPFGITGISFLSFFLPYLDFTYLNSSSFLLWKIKKIFHNSYDFVHKSEKKYIYRIGMHIKLKNPEWGTVIETVLDRFLNSMGVECQEDLKTLQRILESHRLG